MKLSSIFITAFAILSVSAREINLEEKYEINEKISLDQFVQFRDSLNILENNIIQHINNESNTLERRSDERVVKCLAQCANVLPIAWVACHIECLKDASEQ